MNRLISQAASDDYHDGKLEAARLEASARGWDLIETLGGVVAVPHGTELVTAVTASVLISKLRKRPLLTTPGERPNGSSRDQDTHTGEPAAARKKRAQEESLHAPITGGGR